MGDRRTIRWLRWWGQVFGSEDDEFRRARHWLRFVVYSSLFFVLVVGCTFAFLIKSPRRVQLPNLIDQDVVKVLKILQDNHLKVFVYERPSGLIRRHNVIAQVPPPGTMVKEGRTILLTISQGKEVGLMPNLVGNDYLSARRDLLARYERLGFPVNVMRVRQLDSVVPKGSIVSQSPEPNTPLEPGQDVVFVVSSGDESFGVPVDNYRWRLYKVLKNELEQQGIDVVVEKRYTFDSAFVERVFLQNIPVGSLLNEGDSIELYVGVTVDSNLVARDLRLTNVELLRVYGFDVPILYENPRQNDDGADPSEAKPTRWVSLYVYDVRGKSKGLEEALEQGKTYYLPYKTKGRGYLEIHLEGNFFARENF